MRPLMPVVTVTMKDEKAAFGGLGALTPTLSQRERGSPLPLGEGQGEGRRRLPREGTRRDDPLELVVPEHLEEMAEVLVEEYARLGWSGDQLMALFRDPFFQATHHIYHQRGEDYVGSLIQRALARWTIGDTEGGPHARSS